jgi:hypothetical protein
MNTLCKDMIITMEQPALKKRRVESQTRGSKTERMKHCLDPSSKPAENAECRNAQELRK